MTPVSEEFLDVLTPEGIPTGYSKRRVEVHADGNWHRSFHLWIVKEDKYLLFQRRAKSKDLEPGKLDVTVGGHFAAGETLLDVLREAQEEIGLQVSVKDLHYLHTQKVERHYPQAIDREFQEVYVMRCDQPLTQYLLDPKEVEVLYEIPLDRALELYEEGRYVAVVGYDCYQRSNNALLLLSDGIEQARAQMLASLKKIQTWLKQEAD